MKNTCPALTFVILAISLAQLTAAATNDGGIDVAAIDRQRILKAADAALAIEPITITKFRAKLSEGGANDFYSNGDYWWPNPNTTNGLPYVQRDGQTNPENFIKHRECIWHLKEAVAALGAGYKITGDDRYAGKAAGLIRVFFLDAQTRMNPNLQYAQAIPGVTSGRGIGIIDTLHLAEVPIYTLRQTPRTRCHGGNGLCRADEWLCHCVTSPRLTSPIHCHSDNGLKRPHKTVPFTPGTIMAIAEDRTAAMSR